MTRQALAAYLADTYSAEGEHLFAKYPSFLVFRKILVQMFYLSLLDKKVDHIQNHQFPFFHVLFFHNNVP